MYPECARSKRRAGTSASPGRCVADEGPIAQRLEQSTHNALVPGSNPGGPTESVAGVGNQLALAKEKYFLLSSRVGAQPCGIRGLAQWLATCSSLCASNCILRPRPCRKRIEEITTFLSFPPSTLLSCRSVPRYTVTRPCSARFWDGFTRWASRSSPEGGSPTRASGGRRPQCAAGEDPGTSARSGSAPRCGARSPRFPRARADGATPEASLAGRSPAGSRRRLIR